MADNTLEEFLLNGKPNQLLVRLLGSSGEKYMSQLSSEVDTTYAHTVTILQRMENHDIVEFEENGRKNMVHLTDDGEELAELANKYIRKMTDIQQL